MNITSVFSLGSRRLRALVLAPIVTALALLVALAPRSAMASDPRLTSVSPVGGQRGETVTLFLRGNRLGAPEALMFYDAGLIVESLEGKKNNEVIARIRIAPDCRLGEHALRLRTASGLTELQTFWVGALPVVNEKEPNGDRTKANRVKLGVTIHGVIRREDTDVVRFRAEKGTRVRAVIEGLRLGRGFFDPYLRISDAADRTLAEADDTPLVRQDALVSCVVPTTGDYFLSIRDRAFEGANNARYRLHLGTFPQPLTVFPLGGRPGEVLDVAFRGDDPKPTIRKVTVPKGVSRTALGFENESGIAPTPLPFRVSPLQSTREKEPNAGRGRANAMALPGAADGVLETPNDTDWFRLRAKKGDNLEVRVFARTLGSPVDAVIGIVPKKGRGLAYNDDSGGPDAFARARIPADGDYWIYIHDHLRRGGPTYTYRIEVTRAAPLLRLVAPKFARNGQTRQVTAVPAGNRTAALIDVRRTNYGGEVAVDARGLPPGVTAEIPVLPARGTRIPVVFAAKVGTPTGGSLVAWTGRNPKSKATVESRYEHRAELVWARPNNSLYWYRDVDRMAVAITRPVGFTVRLVPSKAPLVQNGSIDLRVEVERDKTFKGPVFVEMLYNPPGVSSRRNVVIQPNKKSALIRVNANGRAPTGRWPIVVTARATVGGGTAWVSSRLRSIEIVPPFASLSFRRAVVKQGAAAEIVATVKALRPFKGKAEARLTRLPPGVTAKPLQFDAKTKELVFPLTTTAKVRLGRFRNIYGTVAQATSGDLASFRTGSLDLRIDRPPKTAPKTAAKAATKTGTPKKKVRLSRLEQLRRAQREREKANDGGDGGSGGDGDGAAPETDSVVRLVAFPSKIKLERAKDRQSFVLMAIYQDGTTRDVTTACEVRIDAPHVATRKGNVLQPLGSGKAALTATFAGKRVRVPITVERVKENGGPNFVNDVMPIFMRAGCNAGSCHGAARGKDGFRLSLFGFDPTGDYDRLTRELSGRRLNLAVPRESLLIEKAVAVVPHSGGKRIEPGSEGFRTLESWIRGGAKPAPKNTAKLTRVTLVPENLVLTGAGATQQMIVTAHYSDGTDRDVTNMAIFLSSDEHTAKLDGSGKLIASKGGEAFVMARYGEHTVGTHVIVRRTDDAFTWPKDEPNSRSPSLSAIDRHIAVKLEKLRVAPSPLASDTTFLRRATIDLIGRLPTTAELTAFVAEKTATKREQLIDRLIAKPAFVDLWVLKWAELLQVRSSNRVSRKTTVLYYDWLRRRIAAGAPIDQMVRELLGASGGTFTNPPATYYQAERAPLKLAENAAQVFLGMRIQCAQCHNHPFDRWTQNDYYGFAAFFAQIARKRSADPREWIIFDRRRGEVRHPVTKQNAVPKFLGGATPNVKNKDRRQVVAGWVTSPENPYFARNIANVIWTHFFGRGIVDPVDDVRISNPASNGPLLDGLAARLIEHRFDLRKIVRDVCTSRAYQRASQTTPSNRNDRANFARAHPRRIKAEVLLDCISQVTTTTEKFRGLPRGARAVQIADGATTTHFLTIFGRPKRETVCSCEVQMEPNLSQALHLINGSTVTQNITRGRLIGNLLKKKHTPRQIVDTIYVRALSRRPSDREWRAFQKTLAATKNKQRALEDIFWAVLNAKEFIFNH